MVFPRNLPSARVFLTPRILYVHATRDQTLVSSFHVDNVPAFGKALKRMEGEGVNFLAITSIQCSKPLVDVTSNPLPNPKKTACLISKAPSKFGYLFSSTHKLILQPNFSEFLQYFQLPALYPTVTPLTNVCKMILTMPTLWFFFINNVFLIAF